MKEAAEQIHEASADLIRRSKYKNSFIFKYSPRPGTAAAKKLKDDVPMGIKKHRNNEQYPSSSASLHPPTYP